MKYDEVPEGVFQALEAVRQGGECNMLDRYCVAGQLADYPLAIYYIVKHKGEYGQLIMEHFSAWRKTQIESREAKP